MYNIEQVVNGITRYIDEDIISKTNGYQKWILGVGTGLIMNKSTELFNEIQKNPLIKSLGVIDGNEIDVDLLYREFKKQADKGSITFDIPLGGKLTLDTNDIDKIYECIKA